MTRRRQGGATTVEFAIVGMVAITVLLALIEFSRLVFVLGTVQEATRRGARMAAVCPLDDPAITRAALFNAPGVNGPSPRIMGLTAGHVRVEYLSQAGTPLASPAANFTQIGYVRVSIANLPHRLRIPLFDVPFTLPTYSATLPRESLGVPRVGVGPLAC